MESSAEDGLVLAKLEDGEDLVSSLLALTAQHGFSDALVLWGIGMVRDLEVGYFNGKAYERTVFREPMELLALHGSISPRADPKFHLHVAVGGPDKHVVGGHVFRATVAVLNEVCLARLVATGLNRRLNPRSGLKELVLERASASAEGTRR